MGLDGVELLLAVEEEFDIAIDDADAAALLTPRMLADYVVACLGNGDQKKSRCLTQAGFYRIRSVLVRQFGASRNAVRPDSPIEVFLDGSPRTQWRKLQKAIDATQLPGLECRKWVAYPMQIGLPTAGLIVLYAAGAPGWTLVAGAFVLWFAAAIATDRLGDIVPENLRTVGALAPYVRVGDRQEWSRDYVLQRVMQITAQQLGIPLEKILPDHHFVRDLGLDS
ncbi:MAG TPA: hypothetical protein VFF03_08160 [Rhodocyclaceae bacterium]|nr:hypothetical protein [Rhodocyclaceae bacterium]